MQIATQQHIASAAVEFQEGTDGQTDGQIPDLCFTLTDMDTARVTMR